MRHQSTFFVGCLIFVGIFFLASMAMAQPSPDDLPEGYNPDGGNAGAGGAVSQCSGDSCTLKNPLGDSINSPQALIGLIIKALLGVLGSIALAMFVFGGFQMIMSAGNSAGVQKGKDTILWATIGLVVIFSAYAIVAFVLTSLGQTQ